MYRYVLHIYYSTPCLSQGTEVTEPRVRPGLRRVPAAKVPCVAAVVAHGRPEVDRRRALRGALEARHGRHAEGLAAVLESKRLPELHKALEGHHTGLRLPKGLLFKLPRSCED